MRRSFAAASQKADTAKARPAPRQPPDGTRGATDATSGARSTTNASVGAGGGSVSPGLGIAPPAVLAASAVTPIAARAVASSGVPSDRMAVMKCSVPPYAWPLMVRGVSPPGGNSGGETVAASAASVEGRGSCTLFHDGIQTKLRPCTAANASTAAAAAPPPIVTAIADRLTQHGRTRSAHPTDAHHGAWLLSR